MEKFARLLVVIGLCASCAKPKIATENVANIESSYDAEVVDLANPIAPSCHSFSLLHGPVDVPINAPNPHIIANKTGVSILWTYAPANCIRLERINAQGMITTEQHTCLMPGEVLSAALLDNRLVVSSAVVENREYRHRLSLVDETSERVFGLSAPRIDALTPDGAYGVSLRRNSSSLLATILMTSDTPMRPVVTEAALNTRQSATTLVPALAAAHIDDTILFATERVSTSLNRTEMVHFATDKANPREVLSVPSDSCPLAEPCSTPPLFRIKFFTRGDSLVAWILNAYTSSRPSTLHVFDKRMQVVTSTSFSEPVLDVIPVNDGWLALVGNGADAVLDLQLFNELGFAKSDVFFNLSRRLDLPNVRRAQLAALSHDLFVVLYQHGQGPVYTWSLAIIGCF